MKLLTITLASLVAAPILTITAAGRAAVDPPTPGLNPKVQAVLDDIRKADTGQLAISAEDGRFLRLLVATNHTRQALEIGAASGYSAIWIGMGCAKPAGGSLRSSTTRSGPRRRPTTWLAPVSPTSFAWCRATPSSRFRNVEGQFDFVFLDAWKRDYQKFLRHGVPAHAEGRAVRGPQRPEQAVARCRDFLDAIETRPDLFSTIVAPSGEGVSVSWKRR